MRAPLIALLCVLAAAATWLALREDGGPPETRLAPPLPAPASAAVATTSAPVQAPPAPPARSPGATSAPRAVVAAVAKPPPPEPPLRRSVFALSSDHQILVQGSLLASADHDLLERESRDDAWATESERLIRQELARQGGVGDFDVIAVDCRQTLCAIEAFSYGEDGHREWIEAMDGAFKEALGNAFSSMNTAFPAEGARAPVLTFLHRRPGELKP
jgi:hypothetical protein